VKSEPEKTELSSSDLCGFNNKSLWLGFLIVLIFIAFAGCENDMKTIRSLDTTDTVQFEYARDIEIYYSDSGRIKAILTSPLMKSYEQDEGYQEFPEGFELIFFDSVAKPQSIINALYGVNYEKKNLMEAKSNVVVKNIEKNEQLDTEHLVWDRRREIIFSDVFVKITKPNEIIFGDGLTSDQNFDFYEIKNPSGEFKVYPDDNNE
jgi:LPS export ABC transporter protein LptC